MCLCISSLQFNKKLVVFQWGRYYKCIPVSDMFIFVSSNIQAIIKPSRWSRACWYLWLATKSLGHSHSILPGMHHTITLSFLSRSHTTSWFLWYISNVCCLSVSEGRVESLALERAAAGVTMFHTFCIALRVVLRSIWVCSKQSSIYLLAILKLYEHCVILHFQSLNRGLGG